MLSCGAFENDETYCTGVLEDPPGDSMTGTLRGMYCRSGWSCIRSKVDFSRIGRDDWGVDEPGTFD